MIACRVDRWCVYLLNGLYYALLAGGRCTVKARLLSFSIVLLLPNLCGAQTAEVSVDKRLDGYAGVGAMSLPVYTGSSRVKTWSIPIARIEYRETAYLYLDRVGVRLWSNDASSLALGFAAEPRFGFQAKDDARLAGLATRRDTIEGGPLVEWQRAQWSLSAGYFADLSGASGGRSLRISIYRQWWETSHWDIGTYLDLDRSNSAVVQYYFGVRPEEASIIRSFYQPGAAVNSTLGVSGAYKLDKRYALLFGSELGYLGASAAASPIVQRRTGFMAYLGIGLVF